MQPRRQATLTRPLQCVSQHHVANLHVSTHMATPDDNNHAAIPFRLHPQIQETHRTTHTGTTTRCRTQRRNQFADETTAAAPAAHTRYTCHRRPKPLHTEKHKVSCSGFLPKTKPMQHSCSHYIAFRSIT